MKGKWNEPWYDLSANTSHGPRRYLPPFPDRIISVQHPEDGWVLIWLALISGRRRFCRWRVVLGGWLVRSTSMQAASKRRDGLTGGKGMTLKILKAQTGHLTTVGLPDRSPKPAWICYQLPKQFQLQGFINYSVSHGMFKTPTATRPDLSRENWPCRGRFPVFLFTA